MQTKYEFEKGFGSGCLAVVFGVGVLTVIAVIYAISSYSGYCFSFAEGAPRCSLGEYLPTAVLFIALISLLSPIGWLAALLLMGLGIVGYVRGIPLAQVKVAAPAAYREREEGQARDKAEGEEGDKPAEDGGVG